MKRFYHFWALVACMIFISPVEAENKSANDLVRELMQIKIKDRRQIPQIINSWGGIDDKNQIIPLLETLTINPKSQRERRHVEAILKKMRVSRQSKLDAIHQFYKDQDMPEVRVDMVHLLSVLSTNREENEDFIKSNLGKLSEGTPVPSRHKEANFPFRINDHTYYLTFKKLNELGYADELNEAGVGSLYGLNYHERDQKISFMRSWLKKKYPDISENNRSSKSKPNRPKNRARVNAEEVEPEKKQSKPAYHREKKSDFSEAYDISRWIYMGLIIAVISGVFWYLKRKSS